MSNELNRDSIHQAVAHHQAGRLAEAERIYRRLLAADPNDSDAMHLLGVVAYQVRRYEDALKLIGRAIEIRSNVAMYHNNLGNVLGAVGRPDQAELAHRRAIQLDPNYVDALVNLATSLRDQAKFDEAVMTYQQAATMAPQLAEAQGNLGTALKDQGRMDEALAAYRRAIELKPDYVDAHTNLLYAMHTTDAISPSELFAEHLRWGKRFAEPLTAAAQTIETDPFPGRALRIGFVSADFREHPVARFLMPFLEHRDRGQFEIVCYSDVQRADAVTTRIQSLADAWHIVAGMPDESLAQFVRSHRIDVLIDLAGHTNGNRLLTFARRPAATQVTFLGYPDTTGMSAMDHRITDELADPAGAEGRHVEKLLRLSGCFLCYPLHKDLPDISPLPAQSNGFITFGSFNNLSKLSPTTIRLWARVLAAVPNSKMMIKTTSFDDEATRRRAIERFSRNGLPIDRVEILRPLRTQSSHLSAYDKIDIALDSFPYHGTTTTCEALSMGVPVVSLAGENHAARVGLSLLTSAGFPQWSAKHAEEFVQIACDLAANQNGLVEIRALMRHRLGASTLCNETDYARKLQRALLEACNARNG